MERIRAFERRDIPAVADLYQRVVRGEPGVATAGLKAVFERTFFDYPWADPEIPSLVAEDDDGIVGFHGSHVRRVVFDGKPARLACGGQLVTKSVTGSRPIGLFLLKQYMSGPQDVTITDGATDVVRRMWGCLGGDSSLVSCLYWTRNLRPGRFAAELARGRGGVSEVAGTVLAPVLGLADLVIERLPRVRLRPATPPAAPVPLTGKAMLEALPRLARGSALRPAYDAQFLDWLFRELHAVATRGKLHAWAVPGGPGGIAGWFVYYLPPRGIAQVVQVAAAESTVEPVLDALLEHARQQGAVAVQGRVEHRLLPALAERGVTLKFHGPFALVHSRNPNILKAIHSGRSFLTRIDGEWWMGHHRERYL